MPLSLAVVGFRHGHINDLVARAQEHPDLNLVAVCEEDEATRREVESRGLCNRVYASYNEMLGSVECDIVAVGDYFGVRGARVIQALQRGKHVISDKPICTSQDELDQIEALATSLGLSVGCMLDIRDLSNFRCLHDVIRRGEIGEVRAISFGGQHPLLYGVRAAWYFEEGKHGGTWNDIGIHAFDLIPWVTGLEFSDVCCARTGQPSLPEAPQFQAAAQAMLSLENGCAVMGDVSYFAPDSHGYALPHYWRITVWGSHGLAETSINASGVTLYINGEESREVPTSNPAPGGYLSDFLKEIKGEKQEDNLTTKSILRASRVALRVQHAADNDLYHVSLEG